MPDFRIVPAQRLDLATVSCTRFGFMLEDHPKWGRYVMSWATMEEAFLAARMLGLEPHDVVGIGYLVPDHA